MLGGLAAIALVSNGCFEKKASPPKALIIDQLASTDYNPDFLNNTAALLTENGYSVSLVPPQNVKVDMYRNLPTKNDKLIIIRSHSTGFITFQNAPNDVNKVIGLFTTEPYTNTQYIVEQIALEVGPFHYPESSETFFGINQFFVEKEMEGKFKGSTIIMTGCNGAITDGMAKAFFSKGAATFIAWDNSVTAQHTDKAIGILLKYLEVDDMSPKNAVAATMTEVGPDPYFGGKLVAFEKTNNN